jgi:antitoxin ParD1/3/4
MARRTALNVSLTPELMTYIAAQVASGRYSSASEVVRTSLRLLQEKDEPPRFSPQAGKRTASRGR